MKGKRIITPVFLLLAALIAGGLGIGYEIGSTFVSYGLIVLLLLLAAWSVGKHSTRKKTQDS